MNYNSFNNMKIIYIMIVTFVSVSSKPVSINKRDVFDIIPDIATVLEDAPECICENGSDCLISENSPCMQSTSGDHEREGLMQRRRQLRTLFVKWLDRSRERQQRK